MKDEFVIHIGVGGQRHYAYLKKHSPTVINVMRMNNICGRVVEIVCNELIYC